MTRKQRKLNRFADDLTIVGHKMLYEVKDNGASEPRIYIHRSRKARRAQARLDGLDWRELSQGEKLRQ